MSGNSKDKQEAGRVLSSHLPTRRQKTPWESPKLGHPSMHPPVLPIAYRNSSVNFYGRDFIVTPDVLIPRPETEMMIDAVLNLMGKEFLSGVRPSEAQLADNITIVDVGTGSGCIGITLKLEIPKARVIATDISEKALKVARNNASELGVKVEFERSDLLKNIDVSPDLVVANLPYVDKEWDWLDKEALSAEPELALYAEDHGLKPIKDLIDQVAERAIPYLVLEADPCQHADIIAYAKAKNYLLVETRGFILVLNKS